MFDEKPNVSRKDRPILFWVAAVVWAVPATVVGGVLIGSILHFVGFESDTQMYQIALLAAFAISICWLGSRKALYFRLTDFTP